MHASSDRRALCSDLARFGSLHCGDSQRLRPQSDYSKFQVFDLMDSLQQLIPFNQIHSSSGQGHQRRNYFNAVYAHQKMYLLEDLLAIQEALQDFLSSHGYLQLVLSFTLRGLRLWQIQHCLWCQMNLFNRLSLHFDVFVDSDHYLTGKNSNSFTNNQIADILKLTSRFESLIQGLEPCRIIRSFAACSLLLVLK